MSSKSISRLVLRAALLAVVATLTLAGLASADTESGQHGHYYFPDASATPEGKCVYYNSNFHTMVVTPPDVWWPDTNSDNHTQHGTVGWSFKLQRSLNSTDWSTFKTTGVQKATAYEDQDNPYGAGTKAPFTKMKLNVDSTKSAKYDWRAVVKAIWYKPGGGVLGYVTHTVIYYRIKTASGTGSAINFCIGAP